MNVECNAYKSHSDSPDIVGFAEYQREKASLLLTGPQ